MTTINADTPIAIPTATATATAASGLLQLNAPASAAERMQKTAKEDEKKQLV